MNTINLIGLVLLILGVGMIVLFGAVRIKHDSQTWGERLKKLTLESKNDMRNLYILSATYGMCEIGELFGNLKTVKELLKPEDYGLVVKFHIQFSGSIEKMYNLVFYRKQLKLNDANAAERFEELRAEALYAYNRLIEIKNEHNITWNDPLLNMPGVVYPLV